MPATVSISTVTLRCHCRMWRSGAAMSGADRPAVATWYSSGWNRWWLPRSTRVMRTAAFASARVAHRPAKPPPMTTTCGVFAVLVPGALSMEPRVRVDPHMMPANARRHTCRGAVALGCATTSTRNPPMADTDKRIALLIDADNAPASKIDVILAEVARHGEANVRRAYGNWKSQHLNGWEKVLHTYAIRPIQQFAYSTGKNASDMAMVIDAMDLLYARNLDGFAIVSSDADFTPLVMRLRNDGVAVYGFGEEKTPEPFVKACSVFLYLEKLGEQPQAGATTTTRAR